MSRFINLSAHVCFTRVFIVFSESEKPGSALVLSALSGTAVISSTANTCVYCESDGSYRGLRVVTGGKPLFIYMWTLCPPVYVTVHPAGGKALSGSDGTEKVQT